MSGSLPSSSSLPMREKDTFYRVLCVLLCLNFRREIPESLEVLWRERDKLISSVTEGFVLRWMINDVGWFVVFSLQVSKSSIKYIDGYYIRYRDYGEGKLAFNILTVVAQKHDFETYSHVIQNLKKYGHYEVFVSPFYKSVEGQPSNTRRVWTAQDRKY